VLAVGGCGSEGSGDPSQNGPQAADGGADGGSGDGEGSGARELITADWLNRSLSFLDLDALLAGASDREEVLLDTLDLSDHAPGPLVVQITPDRKTALVSISAGFFAIPLANLLVGADAIPTDPGKLLFIDLDSRQVVGELQTGDGPMGIAITSDGSRAFVAHFSSNHIAVVDVVERKLIEQVEVGPFSEELVLDHTDTAVIFSYSAAGNFRTFGAADPTATLSPDVPLPGDAAGVAFFPGTRIAFLVQAPNVITQDPPGYTVVDTAQPAAPVVTQDVRFEPTEAVVQYPAVAAPGRGTVMVPVVAGGRHVLREYALDGDGASLEREIDITEATVFSAYGLAVHEQRQVICTMPLERLLSVTDLDTESSFTVPWLPEAGPMTVVIR
jgi:hypothetical protein